MSIEDVEKRVDKFDGNDFSLWRSQIEDYLNIKKLAKTLEGKLPKDMKKEEFVEMDKMALGAVRLSLSNDLYLMRRLFTLKMGKGISVRQQVGIVGDIIEQLASVDVKFDEHIKALVLLTSMPSDWDVTVNSICSGFETTKKLKFNDVRDILI
ncbi:uncharacterized protein LOC112203184 [Rosa chinensis]|uniref:uncharacterized protein LOC112203184 n=1 Tax=Rosa chinensis TaxID=74649 RepID=UPI000D08D80D|nr:uncharacterized protein LOC112203184 [Rosa chinensis]